MNASCLASTLRLCSCTSSSSSRSVDSSCHIFGSCASSDDVVPSMATAAPPDGPVGIFMYALIRYLRNGFFAMISSRSFVSSESTSSDVSRV